MAFTLRERIDTPPLAAITREEEALEHDAEAEAVDDATDGLGVGARAGTPFLGMYDAEPTNLSASSFAAATRHSRSKRSRELRRIDKSLANAEGDATPAALHQLIHECTRYLGKGSKKDSKRRPAVEQLLQQARAQMAQTEYVAADRNARDAELRELRATMASEPRMDPGQRWAANTATTIPAAQVSLPGEGIHLKTTDGWIDPGWSHDRVRVGQRDIQPAAVGDHYAGEEQWAQHRAPHQVLRGLGYAANVTTAHFDDDERAAHRAELGRAGGLIGSAGGQLEDTGGSATGVRGLDRNIQEDRKIFAMSPGGELYLGDPDREGHNVHTWAEGVERQRRGIGHDWRSVGDVGFLHHSSFMAGGDVMTAGTMNVDHGRLKEITNDSGHYTPDRKTLVPALQSLRDQNVNVDLTNVGYFDPDAKAHVTLPRAGGAFLESGGNVELLRARATMLSELRSKVAPVAPEAQGQGQVHLTEDNLLDVAVDHFNTSGEKRNALDLDEHVHLLQEQLAHDRRAR